MSYLDWREISRAEWERPRPPAPNGSTAGGTDYYVTVREQATWPADGSIYAGRRYEQSWTWIGPSADYRQHVVVSHATYPAEAAPAARCCGTEPCTQDDGGEGECAICVPGQCPGPSCPGWLGDDTEEET